VLSILPVRCSHWNCKSGKGEERPGGTGPRSIQIIFRMMRANVRRCPALFAENPDYVPLPLPLAPFGAIASLSSERNAVSKSSALTMNRIEAGCEECSALWIGD